MMNENVNEQSECIFSDASRQHQNDLFLLDEVTYQHRDSILVQLDKVIQTQKKYLYRIFNDYYSKEKDKYSFIYSSCGWNNRDYFTTLLRVLLSEFILKKSNYMFFFKMINDKTNLILKRLTTLLDHKTQQRKLYSFKAKQSFDTEESSEITNRVPRIGMKGLYLFPSDFTHSFGRVVLGNEQSQSFKEEFLCC
jgi:hypothetical protein